MTATGRVRRSGLAPAEVASALGEATELSAGWEVACTSPGAGDADAGEELDWLPAVVPGTAAAALREAGRWRPGDQRDFDSEDWWFRLRFGAEPAREGEQLALVLEGLATVATVYLNGEALLESDSMFAVHDVDVTTRLRAQNELLIHCAALTPLLAVSRRPRARWRTRLVAERNLRFFRTMLLGRAPGFAPSPAAVGPWRPIRLERRRGIAVRALGLRARFEGGVGWLSVQGRLAPVAAPVQVESAQIELSGPTGTHTGVVQLQATSGSVELAGELAVPGAEPWWPHTHGRPVLYEAALVLQLGGRRCALPAGRVGFRTVVAVGELERDGLRLEVNGVPVFARGAVWTPPDLAVPASAPERCLPVLEAARRAGMNMIRIPGTACYESDAFHDACDELGMLVWQDFMFANLDYPERNPGFTARVEREADELLERIGGRPSLAVLCGGSEVAQQAAMTGLNPDLGAGPLYLELLPARIAAARVEVPYVPSTPWGGDLPFRPDRGVANYYGVGAYLRPLEDARRAEVKFAAECLAFSNVPEEEALEDLPSVSHHPRWKAGIPRDVAAGWDFEDVRDHYLRLLFEVDPVALRMTDPGRYLELSRQVTGEVMGEVFGEWRRAGSGCSGGLVLWLKDLMAGAGWGLLDHRGIPKAAYHHLRRTLAPVAVWTIDEGLGGVVVHIANDGAEAVEATLRVAMYREMEVQVEDVQKQVVLEPRRVRSENVEALLGRFVDAAWAYRFGPPAQDLIAASLEQGAKTLSQSFRFPAGRPIARQSGSELGLSAVIDRVDREAGPRLTVSTKRFAYGVRVRVPGYLPDDDAFSVEPGHAREVGLCPTGEPAGAAGHLTALNLSGRVTVESTSG